MYFNEIKFRKLAKKDLSKLVQLKEESFLTTHRVTIVNLENQEHWFELLVREDIHCPKNLILVASSERWLDFGVFKITSVDYANGTADVAWDVFLDYRGCGLGKKLVKAGIDYCFLMLNLRRLTAEILEHNVPSKKCALAAGFVLEGTKRKSVHRNNCFFDSFVYGILRDEWQN